MSSEMRLDVRIPIGMMFTIFGSILTVFGLVSGKEIYNRSLNININLWWGLVMLAFGGFMLIMAWRSLRAAKNKSKPDANETDKRR
jgi:membrane protein implicated in regulation of membrane protease activity